MKNLFFAAILKVNDENSRIRIQDPDPNLDPLVSGMDPRIRIHPKMLWIRNSGQGYGSANPDSYQNFMDPQQCSKKLTHLFAIMETEKTDLYNVLVTFDENTNNIEFLQ